MDQTALERIDKLEKQMGAMIDHYNQQEVQIERIGFDIRFIRAWIAEIQQVEHNSTESINVEC